MSAKPPPGRSVKGADTAARREARLARALRENLRRRKDQGRARQDARPPEQNHDPAPESPSSPGKTR